MHPVKADFSSLVHDMSIYTCWMQLSLYCFLFSNVSSGSYPIIFIYVFPGGSDGKASAYNARDLGSIPGFGRFPWRKKWQPSPVLLPRKSNGRRILVGYSPWGHKESDMTERLHFHFHPPIKNLKKNILLLYQVWNFPGGPVVKNPSCNAGNMDSVPGQRTKIMLRGN